MYMMTDSRSSTAETAETVEVEFKDALGNDLKVGDRIVFATGAGNAAANLTEGVIVELYTREEGWGERKRVVPKAKIRRVNVNGQSVDAHNANSKYWKKAKWISIDKLDRRVAKLS